MIKQQNTRKKAEAWIENQVWEKYVSDLFRKKGEDNRENGRRK